MMTSSETAASNAGENATPVEPEGERITFAELGLAEGGARRHLLESERFRALLAEPELARAA